MPSSKSNKKFPRIEINMFASKVQIMECESCSDEDLRDVLLETIRLRDEFEEKYELVKEQRDKVLERLAYANEQQTKSLALLRLLKELSTIEEMSTSPQEFIRELGQRLYGGKGLS